MQVVLTGIIPLLAARTGNGVLCTGVSQLPDPYLDIRYPQPDVQRGSHGCKAGRSGGNSGNSGRGE